MEEYEILLSEEEQQKVDEGEAAKLLLENPAFLLAVERIRDDCAERILTSAPDQTEQRENLYNLSRGLSAVTAELDQMRTTAETIVENAAITKQEELVQEDPDQDFDY